MKRTVAKLEAFSRNLDDEYGYTIMSNRQFDALFQAIDRSDEVQFRLLFTPLAQQQMLNLLRDKTVGFGDNFVFIKDRMINLVRPAHLATTDITAAPSLFHNYDLAAAREFFNTYSNAYFRALYFALAPVLTIPLYQQPRSHADIYASVLGKTASFWEHEAIANFHGQHAFDMTNPSPKTCSKRKLSARMPVTRRWPLPRTVSGESTELTMSQSWGGTATGMRSPSNGSSIFLYSAPQS